MTDDEPQTVDLDAAVTELYAGPPGEFVTSRQRLVKALRAAKRRDEASEVAALNRPTLVAWAANRAALAHGDRLEALLGAGRDLVEAQTAAITKGDASTLRSARTARQQAISALVDAAVAEASGAQTGIEKHRDELTSLFEAASLDAQAAQQLAAGRLARAPEAASGFGLLGAPDLELGPAARPEPKRAPGKGAAGKGARPAGKAATAAGTKHEPKGGPADDDAPVEAKASAAERRAARAALAEAQRQADAAERDRADLAAALAAARDAAAEAAAEASEREAALADARQRAEEAAAAVGPAEEAVATAEADVREAAEGLEQARAVAAALGE